jgi:hypothetical protein
MLVGSMVPTYVCELYLVKNPKLVKKNSTITEAKGKISRE